MKVYVVTTEYGHYREMEEHAVIGAYSSLALAGRAAIADFFDIVGKPLECIDTIKNIVPNTIWEFYGEDEIEESYRTVTILKVTLND